MFRNPLARIPARATLKSTSQARGLITLSESYYTVKATATGAGRNGRVSSGGADETALELKLATPKSMKGSGDGQNPEQLFAMGYSSCFLGALQFVAGKAGKKDAVKDAKIHVSATLGKPSGADGFGLGVDIKVEGVQDDALIQAAHEFCPYSRAMAQGVKVNVSKA